MYPPPLGASRGRSLRLLAALTVAAVLAACARTPAEPEIEVQTATDETIGAELPGNELTPDLLYDLLLAEIARQRGQVDIALDALSRSAFETRDPRIASRATRLALRNGSYAQALDMARLWVNLEPDSAAADEALAQILVGLGRSAEAEQHFVEMIRRAEPDVAPVYRRIADLMTHQQQPDALLPVMERLVALHPEVAEAHFAQAFLASRLQQREAADAALDQALKIRPKWEDAALAKVMNLAIDDKDEEVQAFAGRFLARAPSATTFRMQYARWLLEQDQIEPALKQFRRVLRDEPDNGDALYAAALLSIERKDYEVARGLLVRHLEQRPEHDQTRLYLGQIATELKDFDGARDWFGQVSDDRLYFEAQLRIGAAMADGGDVEGALGHLLGVAWNDQREEVRLILTREEVLRQAGRLPAAKGLLDEALLRLPDEPDLLYARGLVAAQMKLVDVHERDLRKLIAQEPDNAHAYNALGYTLADLTDRYDEAYALISKALELDPDDPFIMDSMGWVKYRMGHLDQALDYLQRAFDIREDAEIAAHLGEVFWVTGNRRRAESIWRRGLKIGPDNEVLLSTIRKFKQ